MTSPDAIFPSDNDYDIPLLDITLQGDYVDLPVTTYGSLSRKKEVGGTILFYTEDSRFSVLWTRPDNLLICNPISIGEVNFSIYKDFPMAMALFQVYKKRWLSRYYQSKGIRVFADLHVNPAYYDINLLGIPKGWSAYCTRGLSENPNALLTEIEIAEKHAYPNPILFICYGGGKEIKSICKSLAYKNVIYIDDFVNRSN